MANLHKLTVQESLNVETSGQWDVHGDISVTDTYVANAAHSVDVSKYHEVIIDIPTADIAINFSSTQAVNAGDIPLPPGLHTIKIPRGIGKTIYLNLESTSGTQTVKIVKN